ncbi:MAG TPA: hypothetical protein VMX58_08680 [Patescibacteria group bacterium]|nr:hypothetical protein [Patescibacteria group bacterium]
MGEGLIGLIIFIVVLNVLGRILKAVTSAARSGTQQAQQQQKAPPQRTREQQILDELFELERERSEEAIEEGELIEAAAVAESAFPEQAAGFEDRSKPGDFAQWADEQFEKSTPVDTYEYREAIETSPVIDETTAVSEGASAWTRTAAPARKGAVPPDAIQQMLGDASSLRTAVLLSVILGPCRARNRNRRGDRIV